MSITERGWLLGLFVLISAVRLFHLDQPIVENYVGRQIPTAMVARNLERGSGFLFPQLDTAPFPSLFLVEPPIYQQLVVWLARPLSLPLEPSGRAISALATGLAGVSLYVLVNSRSSRLQAVLAAIIFGCMPVSLRYGRAFQPDALAMGLVLFGLALLDRWRIRGHSLAADIGWLVLAIGLAVKVLWLFALLPAGWLIWQRLRDEKNFLIPGRFLVLGLILGSLLVPAGLWYLHAARCISLGAQASVVNGSVWLHALDPRQWLGWETARWVFRFGLLRAYSTLAVALAAWGLWQGKNVTFWKLWMAGGAATLLLVAGKLHHEYYWLLLAPAVAALAAEGLFCLRRLRPTGGGTLIAAVLFLLLLSSCIYHARGTWSTPPEWLQFRERGQQLARAIPQDALVIGREAVLYAADRRGMRMERDPEAIRRARGEWGPTAFQPEATPSGLVSWYHGQGARYYAEMADPRGVTPEFPGDPRSVERVIYQGPGLLLLQLTEPDQYADNEG